MGIAFGVISGNYLQLLLLEKAERILHTLNIILVQDACLLKSEVTRFPLKAVVVFLIEMFHFTSYSAEKQAHCISAPVYDTP